MLRHDDMILVIFFSSKASTVSLMLSKHSKDLFFGQFCSDTSNHQKCQHRDLQISNRMSDIVATIKRINANSFTSEERKESAIEARVLLSRIESQWDTASRLILTTPTLMASEGCN